MQGYRISKQFVFKYIRRVLFGIFSNLITFSRCAWDKPLFEKQYWWFIENEVVKKVFLLWKMLKFFIRSSNCLEESDWRKFPHFMSPIQFGKILRWQQHISLSMNPTVVDYCMSLPLVPRYCWRGRKGSSEEQTWNSVALTHNSLSVHTALL